MNEWIINQNLIRDIHALTERQTVEPAHMGRLTRLVPISEELQRDAEALAAYVSRTK